MVSDESAFPPVAPEKLIETCVLLETLTEDIVGVCGTVVAVALAGEDAVPVPIAFIADTR